MELLLSFTVSWLVTCQLLADESTTAANYLQSILPSQHVGAPGTDSYPDLG
jgi:hypothetical protein